MLRLRQLDEDERPCPIAKTKQATPTSIEPSLDNFIAFETVILQSKRGDIALQREIIRLGSSLPPLLSFLQESAPLHS